MVIVQLMGGLGNQLQQYALYKKFLSLGTEAKIDTSWFDDKNQEGKLAQRKIELERFDGIDYEVCTAKEREALTGSLGFGGRIKRKLGLSRIYSEHTIYDEKVLKFKDMYVEGYFACEYYYHDILPELQKEMVFPLERSANKEKICALAEDIKAHDAVSIHIRRGDYMDKENFAMFGNICTEKYYRTAVDKAISAFPDTEKLKFYIFSDDPAYAQDFAKELTFESEVVDINHGEESFYDIYLMSLCAANITANSTFSFWGGRLNENAKALKIRPTKHKNSQTFEYDSMKRLWPGWAFASPEGKIYE